MSVQSRVLKVLQGAEAPLSARTIQRMATAGKDPSARNVRRTIKRLKDLGHPIYSGADGHLYLVSEQRIELTPFAEKELIAMQRAINKGSAKAVAKTKVFA